ncbi:M48 family metallopeptidase [Microseira sp. BLCC-F43]|jgi:predicted Zn-dependent protease|uniref:M48 family metallopeptidase n=1 Tax=Microseira sp. BLCC-F43 TaxID=3153602 RepID=UPI0035B7BF8A
MLNPLSFVSRWLGRRWFYPLLSFAVALSLVVVTPHSTQAQIPWRDLIRQGIQVIQLSNMSPQQEVQLGQQMNERMAGRQFRLYRNSQITSYVDEIGQRLAAVSDRPNLPFTFQVVRDDNVNAFATTGGFVYVTTGLLRTADNEAQLASVLAHEIGHITRRHLLQQMRQSAIAQGIVTAAGLDRSTAVNLGVDLALNRPRSRKDEFEADQTGLRTLAQAGYPQSAMVGFMEKLLDRPSPPTVLSTHPATRDRIAAIERALDPARANVGDGLDETAYKTQIQPLLSANPR